MTAQIGDIYRYKEADYRHIRCTARRFDPEQFGFSPMRWKTTCMSGFWCRYDISEAVLILQNLTILDENEFYPELNGVACDPPRTAKESMREDLKNETAPIFYHYGGWPRQYHNIGMVLPYTGRILTGAESVRGFYTHLGYQRPQFYKKLIEFVFENGILVDVIDHSHTAELLREGITKRRAEGTWNLFDEHSVYEQLPEEDREKLRWFIDRAVPKP